MTSHLPTQINTTRLRLRSPATADARVIFESYAQDPLVCRYMIWSPHKTEAATREFIESCVEAWASGVRLAYVITEHNSDAAIGMLEARVQSTSVDLGYVLARSHWGQGFMPEAIDSLAAAALATPTFFRVQATCDVENGSSQRALEKAGFLREGRLERFTIHPNISLEPRACFMYAKVK